MDPPHTKIEKTQLTSTSTLTIECFSEQYGSFTMLLMMPTFHTHWVVPTNVLSNNIHVAGCSGPETATQNISPVLFLHSLFDIQTENPVLFLQEHSVLSKYFSYDKVTFPSMTQVKPYSRSWNDFVCGIIQDHVNEQDCVFYKFVALSWNRSSFFHDSQFSESFWRTYNTSTLKYFSSKNWRRVSLKG